MLAKEKKSGGGVIALGIDGGSDIEFDQEPHVTDVMLEKYCCEIGDKEYGETLEGRPRSNAANTNGHHTPSDVLVPHDYR